VCACHKCERFHTLQQAATHCNCNKLQHSATHSDLLLGIMARVRATHRVAQESVCVCVGGQERKRQHARSSRSVSQCVAVCCSVLQCVAVCCSVLQCVAVCCSMLQCVAVCCRAIESVLEGKRGKLRSLQK